MQVDFDDLLRRAAAAQRIAFERALADLDITPAQFAVLRLIAESPGLSSAEASRRERLTPPTMSVIVGNLERKGAVEKLPDPENARIQRLELTALGKGWLETGMQRVNAWQSALQRLAPEPASATIEAWLVRVASIEV